MGRCRATVASDARYRRREGRSANVGGALSVPLCWLNDDKHRSPKLARNRRRGAKANGAEYRRIFASIYNARPQPIKIGAREIAHHKKCAS